MGKMHETTRPNINTSPEIRPPIWGWFPLQFPIIRRQDTRLPFFNKPRALRPAAVRPGKFKKPQKKRRLERWKQKLYCDFVVMYGDWCWF